MTFPTLRKLALGLAGSGILWATRPVIADEVPQKNPSPPATVVSPENAPTSPTVNVTDPLAKQVEQAIVITGRRFLDTDIHTPWQIVHGLLAYRHDYLVKQNGKKIKALDWIASGPSYQGQPWFERTYQGAHAHPYNGHPYAFQGHPSQFMAYMTMCDLPLDFKFTVSGGATATIADFIKGAQAEVNDREEVTWTLWFLSHYLEPDSHWVNQYGEPWSIERLVQIETQKNVAGAACGGTHGLFALAYARNGYRATGRPLYGTWFEADQKVRRYIEAARLNQNSDGTFSTSYFQGPGYSQEFDKRLSSSGHILEFLCVALPQARMSEEWVRRAVSAVSNDLIVNRQASAECGALYHAVDSLVIYRTRVWPELDPTRRLVTAAKPVSATLPPQTEKSSASKPAIEQKKSVVAPSKPAAETSKPAAAPAKSSAESSKLPAATSKSSAGTGSPTTTPSKPGAQTNKSASKTTTAAVEFSKPPVQTSRPAATAISSAKSSGPGLLPADEKPASNRAAASAPR